MKKILIIALLGLSYSWGLAQTKTIYLVRHAKSSHDNPDLIDFDRPLSKRGHQDAKFMSGVLKRRGISPEVMISSPSKRTVQTSNYFKDALYKDYLKLELDSNLYRCSPMTLIHRLSTLSDTKNSVMIFGHNPATTKAANFLQEDTLFQNVPTCGIVAIEIKVNSWAKVQKVKGSLQFFEYPKKHKP